MLKTILPSLIKVGSFLITIITSAWTIYHSGRKDGQQKEQIKGLEEANNALQKSNKARVRSATHSDRGGLYEDDGFKRSD